MIALSTSLITPSLREYLHKITLIESNPAGVAEALKRIHTLFKVPYKYLEVLTQVEAGEDLDYGFSWVAMNADDYLFLQFVQYRIQY